MRAGIARLGLVRKLLCRKSGLNNVSHPENKSHNLFKSTVSNLQAVCILKTNTQGRKQTD